MFEWLFLFPVFKVENSENLLQVQTVFYPAQKRGGKCVHIHTHTRAQLLLYTVRTFIEIMCLMQCLLCVVQQTYRNRIRKNTRFTQEFGNIIKYFCWLNQLNLKTDYQRWISAPEEGRGSIYPLLCRHREHQPYLRCAFRLDTCVHNAHVSFVLAELCVQSVSD